MREKAARAPVQRSLPIGRHAAALRKLYFHFLSHWMGYDRGDSFPFNFEPNGNPFGSKSKGKLSPRSYPIQCERKWKYSFLSLVPSSGWLWDLPVQFFLSKIKGAQPHFFILCLIQKTKFQPSFFSSIFRYTYIFFQQARLIFHPF